MLYHFPTKIICLPSFPIMLDGVSLERVSQIRCLGVVLQDTFSWKEQSDALVSRLRSVNAILAKLRSVHAPCIVRLNIYKSLFLSILNYANVIWGNLPEVFIAPLQVVQNDALRIIFGINSRRTSVGHLYPKHNLLRIVDLFKYNIGIFSFKQIKQIHPPETIFKYTSYDMPYESRTAKLNLLEFRLGYGTVTAERYSVHAQVVKCWNSLPVELTKINSLELFKKRLRLHLVSPA